MQNTQYISSSEKQTQKIARHFAKQLHSGDLVLLSGDLGAGKTIFVRGLASAFSKSKVSSPSFAILHTYHGKKVDVHHFDLYRLNNPNELSAFGGEEILFGPGIKVVEWPQRANLSAAAKCTITIEKLNEDQRRITINWNN